jgi:hypothetical protein
MSTSEKLSGEIPHTFQHHYTHVNKKPVQSQQMLRAKATVERIAESTVVTALMSLLTIWALYNSDIKYAATEKEADTAFEVIISIAFFLFILEIFAQCFYKSGYWYVPKWEPLDDEEWYDTWIRRMQFGSFYFWLDWIATLTLILEVIFLVVTDLVVLSRCFIVLFSFVLYKDTLDFGVRIFSSEWWQCTVR